MAITLTKLVGQIDLTNTSSYNVPSSGSVNLVAGRVYYLAIFTANASTLHDFNNSPSTEVTGTSGAWTFVAQSGQFNAADPARVGLFRYIPSADENGVVISWNPSDLGAMAKCAAFLYEAQGQDTTTPEAQTVASNQVEDATSLTVTLGAAPTSGNLVLAFIAMQDNTEAGTADTDFTQDQQLAGSGGTADSGFFSAQRASASTAVQSNTTSATTSTDDWGGILLELKAAAGASPQTISPSGIASAVAFGVAALVLSLQAAGGISSGEGFGTPQVNVRLVPAAVPSAEAWGTPQLQLALSGAGAIASSEAFGVPVVAVSGGPQIVSPTGISTGEVAGNPILTLSIQPASIGSTEVIGAAQLNLRLGPAGGIAPGAMGAPTVSVAAGPQTISGAGGVASAEAFGTSRVSLSVGPAGDIASAEALGIPRVGLWVAPSGIATGSAFGVPALSWDQVVSLAGAIASAEAFGTAAVGMGLTAEPLARNIYVAPDHGPTHEHEAQAVIYMAPAHPREE